MIQISTLPIGNIWKKDSRIEKARTIIMPIIQKLDGVFDTQDLEHQVLFRMTTYEPKEAFNRILEIIKEQYAIVMDRMNCGIKPRRVFQFGYKRKNHKWIMKWIKGKLYATNGKIVKEIIFKEVVKPKEIKLANEIIQNYHYIHCHRAENGIIIAFYVKGNDMPFAIEEAEKVDRPYKKAVLQLHNIDSDKVAEITRCWTCPNTPKNLMSIIDSQIGKILKAKGYEWMMTACMPAFSKTKATTVSGGIDTPIYSKELKLEFNKETKELCVARHKERNGFTDTIQSVWKLAPVYEFITSLRGKRLNNTHIYHIIKC